MRMLENGILYGTCDSPLFFATIPDCLPWRSLTATGARASEALSNSQGNGEMQSVGFAKSARLQGFKRVFSQ